MQSLTKVAVTVNPLPPFPSPQFNVILTCTPCNIDLAERECYNIDWGGGGGGGVTTWVWGGGVYKICWGGGGAGVLQPWFAEVYNIDLGGRCVTTLILGAGVLQHWFLGRGCYKIIVQDCSLSVFIAKSFFFTVKFTNAYGIAQSGETYCRSMWKKQVKKMKKRSAPKERRRNVT